MKLLRLRVRRLAGFRDGFDLPDQFAEGLTFVGGPSGEGKSSIIRALQALLFGVGATTTEATATFTGDDNREYTVTCDRGAVVWEPSLPQVLPPHLADSHIIRADDIIPVADGANAAFEAEVARQMAGGYDVVGALGAVSQARTGLGSNALDTCRSALVNAEAEQRRTQHEEEQLAALRLERDELKRQVESAPMLAEALRRAEAVDTKNELKIREAGFLEPVRLMAAGDDIVLTGLQNDRSAAQGAVAQAEQEIERATEEIAVTGLTPETCPDLSGVNSVGEAADKVSDAAQALGAAETERQKAAAKLSALANQLSPETPPATAVPPRATQADLANAATHWSQWRAEHAKVDALQAAENGLTVPMPQDADPLRRAIAALVRWLAVPQATAPSTSASVPWPVIAMGVVAALVMLFAFIQNQVVGGMAALIALAAVAVALLTGRPRAVADTGNALRDDAVRDYKQTGRSEPDWRTDAVKAALDGAVAELGTVLGTTQAATTITTVRRGITARREDASKNEAASRATWRDIARRTGIDLHDPAAEETSKWSIILLYIEAQLSLTDAEVNVENTRKALLHHIGEVQAALRRAWPRDTIEIETAPEAREWASRLRDLANQCTIAIGNRRAAAERLAVAQKQLNIAEQEIRRFLERLSLQSEAEFTGLWPDFARIQGVRAQIRTQEAIIEQTEEALRESPELLTLTADRAVAAIERIDPARQRYDALIQSIATTEDRAARAREGHTITDANAAVAAEEARLRSLSEDYLRRQAVRLLLEQSGAGAEEGWPDVLKRTNELFSTITGGRHTVEFRDGRIVARDTVTGNLQRTGELASGTRTQLLLAVRIAFAESVSAGLNLPIFIDEALCVSDPVRFAKAAELLVAMVEEGRQIFYISNDDADCASIQSVFHRRIVDGKMARFQLPWTDGQCLPVLPDVPPKATVPAVSGMTIGEYAALVGAGPFAPSAPASQAHLLYAAFRELEAVSRLLSCGVTAIGPFLALGPTSRRNLGIPEEAAVLLAPGVSTVRAFVEAWQVIGDVLEESDFAPLTPVQRARAAAAAQAADWAPSETQARVEADNRTAKQLHKDVRQLLGEVRQRRLAAITLDQIQREVARTYSGEPRPDGALLAHVEWLYQCARATAAAG